MYVVSWVPYDCFAFKVKVKDLYWLTAASRSRINASSESAVRTIGTMSDMTYVDISSAKQWVLTGEHNPILLISNGRNGPCCEDGTPNPCRYWVILVCGCCSWWSRTRWTMPCIGWQEVPVRVPVKLLQKGGDRCWPLVDTLNDPCEGSWQVLPPVEHYVFTPLQRLPLECTENQLANTGFKPGFCHFPIWHCIVFTILRSTRKSVSVCRDLVYKWLIPALTCLLVDWL